MSSIQWVQFNEFNAMSPIQWVQFNESDSMSPIQWIQFNESNLISPVQWVQFNESNSMTSRFSFFCQGRDVLVGFWCVQLDPSRVNLAVNRYPSNPLLGSHWVLSKCLRQSRHWAWWRRQWTKQTKPNNSSNQPTNLGFNTRVEHRSKIDQKSMNNWSKIDQKSIKNRSQRALGPKIAWWTAGPRFHHQKYMLSSRKSIRGPPFALPVGPQVGAKLRSKSTSKLVKILTSSLEGF